MLIYAYLTYVLKYSSNIARLSATMTVLCSQYWNTFIYLMKLCMVKIPCPVLSNIIVIHLNLPFLLWRLRLTLCKYLYRWSFLFLFLLKFHLITSFWQSTTQYPWLLAPQARTYASICYSRVSDVNLGEPWWTGSASPLLGVERNHSYENNKK